MENAMGCRIWTTATLFALIALGAAAGCGASSVPVAPVAGVVTLGGKPLGHVRVQFLPDANQKTVGPASGGATDDQGRFKLTCADGRTGAVVGWHKVVINDMRVRLPRTPRHGAGTDDNVKTGNADDVVQKQVYQGPRVPDQYTTSGRTPLSIEVKPEKQEIPVELKR
jgi:hypothetical protein